MLCVAVEAAPSSGAALSCLFPCLQKEGHKPIYSSGLWTCNVSVHTHVYAVKLSIEDTAGTQLAVLYREVSLIQRYVDLYTGH